MPLILQSGLISYKSYRKLQHARPRDEPAAAPGARLHDLSEPAAPPPPGSCGAGGGPDHVRLQLARHPRGDDIHAPAHDEHGSSG